MLHVEYVHTRRAPPTSLAHVTLTFPNIEAPSLRFPADSMNRFLDKNSADKPYICLPFLSLSLSRLRLSSGPGHASDGRPARRGFDVSKPGHLFPTTDDRGRQGNEQGSLNRSPRERAVILEGGFVTTRRASRATPF